ncbi:MAG: carbohydrate kinase family protein [Chloroflexi bacterium]|nr:carbohydrate kinase family protein [Chloroflexota bacterium]
MIVCLGDLILDVLVRRAGNRESDNNSDQLAVAPGGAAANTAAWLAYAGAEAGFLGSAGDDFAGDMLIHDLEQHCVVCVVSRSETHPSGILLLETGSEGQVRATAQRGANDAYMLDDVQRQLISTASWLHVTAYAFYAESARPHVLDAIQLARRAGATISLDLGAPHLVHHIGKATYLELLRVAMPRLLFANEGEATLLAGDGQQPLEALARLAPIAVLKRGAAGCTVQFEVSRFDVAAPQIQEIDATGAGDAFAAGTIAALDAGKSLREAIQAGSVLGAKCAATVGGRPPLARPVRG